MAVAVFVCILPSVCMWSNHTHLRQGRHTPPSRHYRRRWAPNPHVTDQHELEMLWRCERRNGAGRDAANRWRLSSCTSHRVVLCLQPAASGGQTNQPAVCHRQLVAQVESWQNTVGHDPRGSPAGDYSCKGRGEQLSCRTVPSDSRRQAWRSSQPIPTSAAASSRTAGGRVQLLWSVPYLPLWLLRGGPRRKLITPPAILSTITVGTLPNNYTCTQCEQSKSFPIYVQCVWV